MLILQPNFTQYIQLILEKRRNNDSQTLLIQKNCQSKKIRGHEGGTLIYTAITSISLLQNRFQVLAERKEKKRGYELGLYWMMKLRLGYLLISSSIVKNQYWLFFKKFIQEDITIIQESRRRKKEDVWFLYGSVIITTSL